MNIVIKFILIISALMFLQGCMAIPIRSALKQMKDKPINFNFNIYSADGKEVTAMVKGSLRF